MEDSLFATLLPGGARGDHDEPRDVAHGAVLVEQGS
jgi:hypothetical protein